MSHQEKLKAAILRMISMLDEARLGIVYHFVLHLNR